MPRRYALVVDAIVKGARKGRRDLEDLGVGGGKAAQSLTSLTKVAAGLGAVIGALGLARVAQEVAQFAVAAAKAADIQAQAEAQLAAAVKSTGGAAGLTVKELKDYASQLQRLTGIGDEVLIMAEAQLLTFTKIGREAFPQVLKSAVDLSARMDQDLRSSVVQLGKALNDPIANLGELGRAGIQFSKEQKEVIKALAESGRLAEAQAIILKELETQFGGAAEAARDTLGGALKALSAEWGDLLEDFGSGSGELQGVVEELIRGVRELRKAVGELKEGFAGLDEVVGFFIRLKVHQAVDKITGAVRLLNRLLGRHAEGWRELAGTDGPPAGFLDLLRDMHVALPEVTEDVSEFEKAARRLLDVQKELAELGSRKALRDPRAGGAAPDVWPLGVPQEETGPSRGPLAQLIEDAEQFDIALDELFVDLDRLDAEVKTLEHREFMENWAGAAAEIAFALGDINSELGRAGFFVADLVLAWDSLETTTDKWIGALTAAASLMSALTDETKNYSRELQAAGAAIGAVVGAAAFGDPQTGSQIGSAIGQIVGTFISKGADRFVAEIATGTVGQDLAAAISKVEGETGKLGKQLLDGIFGALQSLSDQLGADISVAKFAVMIEDDIIKVFVNGLTGIFDNVGDAIAFAVSEALRTSTITGVGDQVRAALTSGGFETFEELEAVLALAHELEGAAGQWATALRELQAENAAAIRMAQEHGLSLDLVNKRNQERLDLLQREIDQAGASELSSLIGLLRQVHGEQFAAAELQLAQTQLLALQLLTSRDALVELIAAGTALGDVAAGLLETVDATVEGLLTGTLKIRRRGGGRGRQVAQERGSFVDDLGGIIAGSLEGVEKLFADYAETVADLEEKQGRLNVSSELYEQALAALRDQLDANLRSLGEGILRGLSPIGDMVFRIRDTAEAFRTLEENAEAFGLTAQQVANTLRDFGEHTFLDIASGLAQMIGDEQLIQELQIAAQRLQIDMWEFEIRMLHEAGLLDTERYDELLDLIGRARDATDEWADALNAVEEGILGIAAIGDMLGAAVRGDSGGTQRPRGPRGEDASASPADTIEDLRREMERFLPVGAQSPSQRLAELNEIFSEFARRMVELGGPLDEVNDLFADVIEAFERSLIDPLRELRQELLGEVPGSRSSFQALQQRFQSIANAALGGDVDAIADLPDAIRAFRDSIFGRFGANSAEAGFFNSQFLQIIGMLEAAGINVDPFTASGSGGASFAPATGNDLMQHSNRQYALLEEIRDLLAAQDFAA